MNSIKKYWKLYRAKILNNCTDPDVDSTRSEYWQNKLFASSLIYLIPLSFIAIVPGVYMAWITNLMGLLGVDLLAIAIFMAVALVPGIPVFTRKLLFNGTLYIAATALLIYLGSLGPGLLYLFGITVFVVLSLDKIYGFISVALNTLICLAVGLFIYLGNYDFVILQEYELGSWIAVSSNLIFLSAVAVLLIPILFKNLQSALIQEKMLRSDIENDQRWLRLLESAVEHSSESIAIIEARPSGSTGRNILYVNDAFEEMTGYARGEVIGNSFYLLNGPKTSAEKRQKLLKALEEWRPYQTEFINYKKDGSEYWVHVSFSPVLNPKGKYSHWVVVGRNITDRKRREKDLEESIQEKETLLKEIHHRVKNNLAVVSSMMHLQAMQEEDESLQKKLFDSIVRIRTMGTIHELLYQSKSFSKLDLAKNLKNLVSMIIDTIGSERTITVDFHCEDVELNMNQAIPSSLIVNEVVTNALKHAFNGNKNCTISVELREIQEQIEIKVRDNGIGIPDKSKRNGSLGMQLIDVLARQIEADYTYAKSPDGGTLFKIQFEKNTIRKPETAFID